MSIRFERFDGLFCPVFICDLCGQPIQGPDAGLIQWNDYDDPICTVLHKGPDMPCARQWDSLHEHDDSWVGWRSLTRFLDQLAYNTRHPFKEEVRS